MAAVEKTFVLVGPHAGKTMDLGNSSLIYRFINGKCAVICQDKEMPMHEHYLYVNWQIRPEGHPDLTKALEEENGERDIQPDGTESVQSLVQPFGEGTATGIAEQILGAGAASNAPGASSELAGRDGPAPELNMKLQRAVLSLDPKDDSHWTKDGKPAITAVATAYGAGNVTRGDVEAAAPGFVRPTVEG
jgi:hypothetical protein